MNKEKQFERIYKETENFGRTQFVREIQMQINDNKKKDKEIERLNNIINELEKLLNEEVLLRYKRKDTGLYTKLFNEGGQLYREYIIVKLKELKGGK